MIKINFILLLFLFISFTAIAQSTSHLKTTVLTINNHKLTVEIADTEKTMQRGLMFRKELSENNGMLFVFPRQERAMFWMKNTSLPLSIAYIDRQGMILEIHPLEPYSEKTVFSRSEEIRYALEVNRGWFEANGIKDGDTIQGLPKF